MARVASSKLALGGKLALPPHPRCSRCSSQRARAFDGSERLIRANSATAAPHVVGKFYRVKALTLGICDAHAADALAHCRVSMPVRPSTALWRVPDYVPSYTPMPAGRDATFASPLLIRPDIFASESQCSNSPGCGSKRPPTSLELPEDARSSITAREAFGSANRRRIAKLAVE
ncbi:hypothetical protein C8R44DRAFT_883164 [Mycena epipterygia]|nr:hypothetical protein C8R44DRAFT_883164 [Mycena epipterygia]